MGQEDSCVKTRLVDVLIKNDKTGETLFEKKGFEVPEGWSNQAADICASKYAMDYENSALTIINRIVDQTTKWGKEQGYFRGGNGFGETFLPEEFNRKLKDIMVDQRAAPNSPVFFNVGVPEHKDQTSACFILGVEDTMESILGEVKTEGLIFKHGSGAGLDISPIRAKGELLSNKGTSSGPIGFVRGYDSFAGAIKSGGRSRRSARLICMDVDHPDIMEFIECKKIEEDKASILIKNGISEDVALATVAHQNANHSIRVSDEFMQACEAGKDWHLVNRGDGKVAATLPARNILRKAAEVAWHTGDPGIQYDDRINLDNPVPSIDKIRASNPCAEFNSVNFSSCNLSSLNLVKYYENSEFNSVKFKEDIKVLITAMDIYIDASYYPLDKITETTHITRSLGLGFSNLGALLMLMGLPYASKDGRGVAARITREMTINAYEASIELARKLGSFEAFEDNKDVCLGIAERLTGSDEILSGIREHGLRNSQLTLLAPTGTTSLIMQCDTYSLEPLYALESIKKLSDGSIMTLQPACVKQAARSLQEKYKNPPKTLEWVIADNQDVFATANEVHWKDHILMMSAIQCSVSGALSKTVNLPNDCTISDIEDAYIMAWKEGLKAVAVYRDGSKAMQPLTAVKEEVEEEHEVVIPVDLQKTVRIKLPDERKSITHKFTISGYEGYVTIGMYDNGTPGEMFLRMSKEGSVVSGLLDSFATVFSMSLQYGVPLTHLVAKLKATRFEPSGLTHNDQIPIAKSIADYLARWLEYRFLCELDEDEEYDDRYFEPKVEEPIETSKAVAVSTDCSGPPCNICEGMTFQSGTCFTCSSCGATTGCG